MLTDALTQCDVRMLVVGYGVALTMCGTVGDGGNMPGNTCSNCIAFKYKCTYVETASVRMSVDV